MSGRHLNLVQLKMMSKAKDEEEKLLKRRKRDILVLIMDYLVKNGYMTALERLERESGFALNRFHVADNMELSYVFQQFEEFFSYKYNRAPVFVRKADATTESTTNRYGRDVKLSGKLSSGAGNTRGNKERKEKISYANVDKANPADPSSKDGLPPLARKMMEQQQRRQYERRASSDRGRSQQQQQQQPQQQQPQRRTVSADRSKDRAARTRDKQDKNDDGGMNVNGSSSGFILNKKQPRVVERKPSITEKKPTPPPSASQRQPLNEVQQEPPAVSLTAAEKEALDRHDSEDEDEYFETRILKPLPQGYYVGQMAELADAITRDIHLGNPGVHWDDVAELHTAKQLLKEAVVMPVKYPQFFTGLLAPWKGVLLYGPPGTGKTMLARAVATECRTTFFNISASSIVSKFRGDSEKLIRVLFELARYHAPSTIFIDEMDAIMGARGHQSEHEGSRRMKTELLIQMDGLSRTDDLVFVLAASNLPWTLDVALLRRLEKRIYIPLPTVTGRQVILERNLKERSSLTNEELHDLALKTEAYSGSDIVLLCKEAAMRPVRALMKQLSALQLSSAMENHDEKTLQLPLISSKDVHAALACTKPSASSKYLAQYAKWADEFGSAATQSPEDEEEAIQEQEM